MAQPLDSASANDTQQTATPAATPNPGSDPSQTSATPIDSASEADNAGGIQQGFQQSPASTAAQFPAPGSASSAPGQDQTGKPPTDLSKPQGSAIAPAPIPPAVQQAQQKAGWVHSILQQLGGGPQTKTVIDPNTGTSSQVQVPMSNAQYGRALATAVLTGAFSGLGVANGPGNEGRAAAAGFDAVAQQKQQAQAKQAQQASQDYARQAAIAQTNFQTRENALRLSSMDYDFQKRIADSNTDMIGNARDQGHVVAEDVAPEDLMPKYHVTKDQAVPSKVVQTQNPDGTYSTKTLYTVLDPDGKIQVPQDLAAEAAAMHQPGTFQVVNGKTVPKDFSGSGPAKINFVANLAANTHAGQITEKGIDDQLAKITDANGQPYQPINMAKAFDNGLSNKAVKAWTAFSGMPLDQGLEEFQKSKVNQDSGGVLAGQIRSLIPDGALETLTKNRLDKAAADKLANDEKAELGKQQTLAPGKLAEETAKDKVNATYAYTRSLNEAKGKAAGEAAAGVSGKGGKGDVDAKAFFADDPILGALITPANLSQDGINHKFLDAFTNKDPELGGLVMQILSGKNSSGMYGLAKGRGQMLDAAVAATSSEYSKPDAVQYQKTKLDFGPSGKAGKALQSGGTAFTHLANLNDAVDKFTTGALPGFKTFGDWLDSDKAGQFATGIANVPQELGVLYAGGGAPHEGDVKSYRDAYHGPPDKVKAALKQQAINAMDKMETTAEAYYASVPSTFVKPPTFLSDRDAANYTKLTGLPVDPKLLLHAHVIGDASGSGATNLNGINNNTSQAERAPGAAPVVKNPLPGATTTKRGSDGKLYQFNDQGKYLGPA